MFSSKKYWIERYAKGGNSGVGSYKEAAIFKAKIINEFISEYNINSIVDLGSGDGNQISFFKGFENYYGFDISYDLIKKLKEKFKNNHKMSFFYNLNEIPKADLSISLDVLFHLIEKDVYTTYINNLFDKANKYVIIYSRNSNFNGADYFLCREFITDIKNILDITPFKVVDVPNTLKQKNISFNVFAFYKKEDIKK